MDLWVLPPPTKSAWFAKIDWYLNWQMSKGLSHVSPRASAELLQLTSENGMDFIEPPMDKTAPLMVISNGRIPAQKCVVIDFTKSLKAWLTSVHRLSELLQVENLRVFLPPGSTPTEAQEIWRSCSTKNINIEFSPDEDAAK